MAKGKKIKINWDRVISVIALIISLLALFFSIIQQNKINNLTEKQIELQKSETEYNQVIKLYEISKDNLNLQKQYPLNTSKCLSIIEKNKELFNNATRELQNFEYLSAKIYLQKMNLSNCYVTSKVETKELRFSIALLILNLIFILILILWIIISRKRHYTK